MKLIADYKSFVNKTMFVLLIVHKFLYANLITFKEEFYILVTSLTRLRRETTCCICIRLKVISFEYFYDYFYTSNSKLYMENMYFFWNSVQTCSVCKLACVIIHSFLFQTIKTVCQQ